MKVQIVGLSWYRAEHFERLVTLFEDGQKLPSTYAKWLAAAEQLEKKLMGDGFMVVRAYIDPEEFPRWCAANGCKLDAKGRMAFANWTAMQAHTSGLDIDPNN